jgi:hypothetical protein
MHTNVSVHVAQVLKWAYGLLFMVVGLDKVFTTHLITDWDKYVSPIITGDLGLGALGFLVAWGIIEVIIGLILLSPATKTGAWMGITALALIVLNLLTLGDAYLDIAARDIMMALGLYALARLSENEPQALRA